jgi:hypothetical protein
MVNVSSPVDAQYRLKHFNKIRRHEHPQQVTRSDVTNWMFTAVHPVHPELSAPSLGTRTVWQVKPKTFVLSDGKGWENCGNNTGSWHVSLDCSLRYGVILVLWLTPCGLVGGYRRFGGIYCLHLQSEDYLRIHRACSVLLNPIVSQSRVSIMTGYELHEWGLAPGADRKFYFSSLCSRPAVRPTQPLVQWVLETVASGVKRMRQKN